MEIPKLPPIYNPSVSVSAIASVGKITPEVEAMWAEQGRIIKQSEIRRKQAYDALYPEQQEYLRLVDEVEKEYRSKSNEDSIDRYIARFGRERRKKIKELNNWLKSVQQ